MLVVLVVVVLRGVIISIAIINGAKCQDHRAGKKQGSKLEHYSARSGGTARGWGESVQYAIQYGGVP